MNSYLKFFLFLLFYNIFCFADFENLFQGNFQPLQVPSQKSLLEKKNKVSFDDFNISFSNPKQWQKATNKQSIKSFLTIFQTNIKNSFSSKKSQNFQEKFLFLNLKSQSFLYVDFVFSDFVSMFLSQSKNNSLIKKFLINKQKVIEIRSTHKGYLFTILFFKPFKKEDKIPMFYYGFQKKYFKKDAPKVASSIDSIRLKKNSKLKQKIKNLFKIK